MTDPAPVPDPVRPRSEVRGAQVWAGFGLGLAGSWVLRLVLFGVACLQSGEGFGGNLEKLWPPLALLAIFGPSAALLAAILWAARTRRKGLAIGMSIYAGVGGLLLGPMAIGLGAAVAICGQW